MPLKFADVEQEVTDFPPPVFNASYHGWAMCCDGQIRPGDAVRYEDGDLIHVECADE